MQSPLARILIGIGLVLVSAYGGASEDGGSTIPTITIEAPSFDEIAGVLAAGGIPCEQIQDTESYFGDAPMASCRTSGGTTPLARWTEGAEAEVIASWAVSSYCDRVASRMYVDASSWTAHPLIIGGAQDQALLDAVATASRGSIVTVEC